MAGGNYVGLLQEKCMKINTSFPEYVDCEIGSDHMFRCTCLKGKWTAEGVGMNKKDAKQKAAKLMLSILNSENIFESCENNEAIKVNYSFVSKLNEYCTKERKMKPLFSEKPEEDGLAVIECSFDGFIGVGRGSSKKKAKEIAAEMVVNHFGINKYFDNIKTATERFQSLKNSVTQLHELCQSRKLSIEFKETCLIVDKKTMYEYTCNVGDFETKSSRYISKKEAKIEAACLMLNILDKNTPASSPQKILPEFDEQDDSPSCKKIKFV